MRQVCCAIPAFLAIVGICEAANAADAPPRSQAGQTLVAPKAHLDQGEIYHIYTGEDAQLVATSTAQLQRLAVTCRRVVGYFVTPFDRTPEQAPISSGAGRIPVASLDTGVSAWNELLQSEAVLDAAKFPEITFVLTGVSDARKTSSGKEPEQFSASLQVDLNVKGKTIAVTVPATITLLPFTFRTMARYPGDILTLRADFDLKLAALGLEKPGREWTDKLADGFSLSVFLLANTVSPEKSLDPALKQPHNLKHIEFMTKLRDFNDPKAAYAFGRAYMQEIWNEAGPLARLAAEVVAEDGIRTRDLAFALKAAQRAAELSENKSSDSLSTLARVHFERGEIADAIRVQKQALDAAKAAPPPAQEALKASLARYEAGAAQR